MKKGINKKVVPGIFRFVSMLFQIFEKESEQKPCSSIFFQIYKYAFIDTWKRVWPNKVSQVVFRLISMLF